MGSAAAAVNDFGVVPQPIYIVDVNGNPISSSAGGGVYNVVPPTPANGATTPVQQDSHGNAQVNLATYLVYEDEVVGVAIVEERYNKFVLNANSVGVAVKGSPGFIHALNISAPGTAWIISVYDALTATGTPEIYSGQTAPIPYILDQLFTIGIFIVASGTTPGSLNISWR